MEKMLRNFEHIKAELISILIPGSHKVKRKQGCILQILLINLSNIMNDTQISHVDSTKILGLKPSYK